jgi:hypothetical protein
MKVIYQEMPEFDFWITDCTFNIWTNTLYIEITFQSLSSLTTLRCSM